MKWYVSSAPSSSSSWDWAFPLGLAGDWFWGLAFSFPLDLADLALGVGLGLEGVPLVLARLAAGGWEGSVVDLALRWASREVVVSKFRAPRMSAGLSGVLK